MDPSRIAHLLAPFLNDAKLANTQLTTISTYIDLLLRWNTRINLTAVRDPEEIVTRHFGESLFAALHLFPPENSRPHPGAPGFASFAKPGIDGSADLSGLLDLGSGAGFPGIPIKLWAPHLHVTLIESNQKKATFLREVCRATTLTDVNVLAGRAETYTGAAAGTVTMRAVERFDSALAVARRLIAPLGRLALLIGTPQAGRAHQLLADLAWSDPIPIPLSSSRVLVVGTAAMEPDS